MTAALKSRGWACVANRLLLIVLGLAEAVTCLVLLFLLAYEYVGPRQPEWLKEASRAASQVDENLYHVATIAVLVALGLMACSALLLSAGVTVESRSLVSCWQCFTCFLLLIVTAFQSVSIYLAASKGDDAGKTRHILALTFILLIVPLVMFVANLVRNEMPH